MLPRHTSTTLAAQRHTPLLRVILLIALLVAGLTAGAVVTASPAGAAVPARTDLEKRIDWAILRLVNKERAIFGLRPLRMVSQLRLSARRHNVQMAAYNEMSHQLPGEPDFTTRMSNAGYQWSWAGENIAWNSEMTLPGVTLLQRLMYHEKPPNDAHRLNILSTHYRNIGVDVYLDRAHHKVWLTTDFGKPLG
ncbi:MAG: hypothetical protein QOH89_1532 [Pseudonocardiales bacterium]|jgi:uncharacterized protein YkwD|nr:hypothetical protein [Pseudonocardiales bacterium]MDT4940251.1 hypothetical protein [Pseudonocardiales bacterium]